MMQMNDDQQRILAEAQIVNQLFKARSVPVTVPPDSRRMPSHFLTPTTVVYDLQVPMTVDGSKLLSLQDDVLSYIRQFRRMNGIVTLDESGMEAMPTVRLDRYEHTVEISRPKRDTLAWNSVQWQAQPNTALCGLHYNHGGVSPVLWDFSRPDQPHGLIAGATGSGKTNQLLSVLYSLMLNNDPANLHISFVDPKHSDGMQFLDGLPHIKAVARDLEDAVHLITKFHGDMVKREKGIIGKEIRHILAIEECASLTDHPDKQVRNTVVFLLEDIARRCREANMNLIVCTQKPTAEVLGGQLKSNLLMRLVGSVTSKEDANVAVQMKASGAEALPGYGSFIYRLNRTMLRFQVPLIDVPVGLCRKIMHHSGGAWVVQGGASTGANAEKQIFTRVENTSVSAPVQVVQAVQDFPLLAKRPPTKNEAAEIRRLAETMSKNQLCIHVYGAKSSRYMEWINAVLDAEPSTEQTQAPTLSFRGAVREMEPM